MSQYGYIDSVPPVLTIPFKHPPDKMVLWSYMKDYAQKYALFKRRCTLESTPVASYVEKLIEFLEKGGPELADNQNFTFTCGLWDLASARVAKYSSEEVIVILDGDRETPFDLGSTLARVEIGNLTPPKVKSVKVLMVTKNSQASCCSENNLRELRKALHPKISLTCEKAPRIMYEEISLLATMYCIYKEAKKLMS